MGFGGGREDCLFIFQEHPPNNPNQGCHLLHFLMIPAIG